MIKLLPVVDPVRMNAELTCQLSDRPVPPRGGERFLRRRRACWERGGSKSVVLLTGDRWFESISLQQRVVQTIGSSAVELTSLILGRSVRVTSATHGEAEREDTVRALRKPGVSGRSGFSPPARATD